MSTGSTATATAKSGGQASGQTSQAANWQQNVQAAQGQGSPPAKPVPQSQQGTYVPQRGDSIYKLWKRDHAGLPYDQYERGVRQQNDLGADGWLHQGEPIVIPQTVPDKPASGAARETVVPRRGDSIYKLWQRSGSDLGFKDFETQVRKDNPQIGRNGWLNEGSAVIVPVSKSVPATRSVSPGSQPSSPEGTSAGAGMPSAPTGATGASSPPVSASPQAGPATTGPITPHNSVDQVLRALMPDRAGYGLEIAEKLTPSGLRAEALTYGKLYWGFSPDAGLNLKVKGRPVPVNLGALRQEIQATGSIPKAVASLGRQAFSGAGRGMAATARWGGSFFNPRAWSSVEVGVKYKSVEPGVFMSKGKTGWSFGPQLAMKGSGDPLLSDSSFKGKLAFGSHWKAGEINIASERYVGGGGYLYTSASGKVGDIADHLPHEKPAPGMRGPGQVSLTAPGVIGGVSGTAGAIGGYIVGKKAADKLVGRHIMKFGDNAVTRTARVVTDEVGGVAGSAVGASVASKVAVKAGEKVARTAVAQTVARTTSTTVAAASATKAGSAVLGTLATAGKAASVVGKAGRVVGGPVAIGLTLAEAGVDVAHGQYSKAAIKTTATLVGSAIGTAIPIPILGTAVGGAAGAIAGEYLSRNPAVVQAVGDAGRAVAAAPGKAVEFVKGLFK